MAQLAIQGARAVGAVFTGGLGGLGQVAADAVASYAAQSALSYAQTLIWGPTKRKYDGRQIDALRLQASTEGAPIPILYGRYRIAGQIIWASRFLETVSETTSRRGGKGGRPVVETTQRTYLYSVSLAIGLCAGEIDGIGRVWADGKPISLSDLTWRLYKGTPAQLPDSLIEAVEGEAAPAYRDLAYIVFEDLPLAPFGNRIPQFTFEIFRSLRNADEQSLENVAGAVAMLPGSGEFVYGTTPVTREISEGVTQPENVHANSGDTDFETSLDLLQDTLPNCRSVGLIVSWFGTDLRLGQCQIRPAVESDEKKTAPFDWRVSGLGREDVPTVSLHLGNPAYGGTPSDICVIEAIRLLKARGLSVLFYPFILMDIPVDNQLPDGKGGTGQPAYPWRGRIAPVAPPGTEAVGQEVAAFMGTAQPGDFSIGTQTVSCARSEYSFRRMILHYAHLCELAGGVDAFLIGSEMRGLTTARADGDSFPAVEALCQLARDVRSVVGPDTRLSYAADWSEYFGHQPADGSGSVFFHLDPLWADPVIDFIGIDNYMPLSDWRDGTGHADWLAGWRSPYDPAYLQSNIAGGEGFDWFYADEDARATQNRTPITDGAYGEPWVYRYKDLHSWWANPHFDRPGGIRATSPTAWVPQSKPFVFTELGCAAVDKASNQPNIFPDPKSTEDGLPHFSTGQRDDMIQRRFLEAHAAHWSDPVRNPVSTVYGGPMVLGEESYLYAWDARPFPHFPARDQIWADASNWLTGHWLNGRAGRVPLDLLVQEIAGLAGPLSVQTGSLAGLVTGFLIDAPSPPRAALERLAGVYQFDAREEMGGITFLPRGSAPVAEITQEDLVDQRTESYRFSSQQAEDLPLALRLRYVDDMGAYDPAIAEAQLDVTTAQNALTVASGIVMDSAEAAARAQSLLADGVIMNTTVNLRLAPTQLALQVGDVVSLSLEGTQRDMRIASILDGEDRALTLTRTEAETYALSYGAGRMRVDPLPVVAGTPVTELLDLPILPGQSAPAIQVAAFSTPWPGGIDVYRVDGQTPQLEAVVPGPALMGRLRAPLAPGPVSRWDRGTLVSLDLLDGMLEARPAADVLAGANRLAVETDGGWEVLQFQTATLQPDGSYHLSGLLRGQGGSEHLVTGGAPAGARVVVLNDALLSLSLPPGDVDRPVTRLIGPAGKPPSDTAFLTRTDTMAGIGWQPLSPVHLRAQSSVGGQELSWIRRGRIDADGWGGVDIPLGETTEAYQVSVYDGSTLLRQWQVDDTRTLYTAADQATDFGPGPLPESAIWQVAQLSDGVGAGQPATGQFAR